MSRRVLVPAALFALATLGWLATARTAHANPPPYGMYGYTPGAYDDEGPVRNFGYQAPSGPIEPYGRYGYTPGAYDYTPRESAPSYTPSYSFQAYGNASPVAPAAVRDRKVHLSLRLPAHDAHVWFNGQHSDGKGAKRLFESPALPKDGDYAYNLKVSWKDGGKALEKTRRVVVHPGDSLDLTFERAAARTPVTFHKAE
jgi:uncharacterized protein (TIGR03000 family)